MRSVPRHLMVVASLLFAACSTVAPAPESPPLADTAWVLASLPGRELAPGAAATMQFDAERVYGSDSCNRFSAPYTATASKFTVGPRGASTMMACPPALMEQAEAFMSVLSGARGYRVADGRLELVAADGAVLATFVPQSRTLAGTSWRVTGYNNGRHAVVSTLSGTSLTLSFSVNGRASGSAGCNNFTATYALDGQKLRFGPAAATRKVCAHPEGVMDQEQQFLRALENVTTARFEGDRLELRGASGELVVTLAK